MKNAMTLATFGLALAGTLSASAFTFVGRNEISANGDFDGNGRPDVVILDRESGSFRIAYQTAVNVYTWADPRASGAENATGLSVGKLFQTTRDSLAISSVLANRVNLIDVPAVSTSPVPLSAFVPGIGPNQVIAINIPGAGDTAHDDLIVATAANGGANPARLALMRNNAGAASLLIDQAYPEIGSANRVTLKKAGADVAGFMIRNGATDDFRVVTPSAGAVTTMFTVAGFARGSQFISGNFNGGAFNHVLFFRPGATNFSSLLASEPVAGVYALGSSNSFSLGKTIAQLFPISTAGGDRLLAMFQDGTATEYTFNGSSAPVLLQDLAPDAGERFTSAMPTPGGDLLMFSGTDAKSENMRRYIGSPTGFTAGPKTSLPTLTPLSAGANVFIFRQEPFVSNQPDLLQSLSAGDWTSDPLISGGNYSATVWNNLGGSLGLRSPASVNFGPIPPTGTFGLANQFAPSISLFSRAPAVGAEVVDVRISPDPGEYKVATKVSLTSTLPGAQLFYRLSAADAWTLYTAPIQLFKTTSIQYYGKPIAGDRKSRIHIAQYTFPISPATQDSDNDGIPDYVEIALGLNPNGGKDQDGDGFTDLNEIIVGTNALNNAAVPADAQRLEEKSAFDLLVGLQPIDGTTGSPTTARIGANLRAYDLFGSIQRAGTAKILGVVGVIDPAIRNTNILVSAVPPLVIAATDAHFDIATPGSDKHLGRELLGVIPAPRPALPTVPYVYGGGSPAVEAANWLASAKAVYNALPREIVKKNLKPDDVLVALMFERKVSQILQQRGNPAWSNLTLFPFRPSDSGRTNPSATLLKSLETRLDDAHPGFKLATVQAVIQDMVNANAPAGMIALKTLTKEIYRVSSASNNAAPAKYPSPVDTLRNFFDTGILHSNYLAAVVGVNLASASNAFTVGMSIIDARPTATLDLVVRADTFDGDCTRLDTATGPVTQKSLIHPGGEQYRLLESFNLLPGSHVHVFGYTDVTNAICSGDAVEVITLALDSVPEATPIDTDGDLLLDALEFLLFGSLSNNGLGDTDGDGYSNLQELLDGSDPGDANSHGAVIANLAPPAIEIEALEGSGNILLSFDFPAAYANALNFKIKSTTQIGLPFSDESLTPVHTGGNHFEVLLPNPGTNLKFYLLSMSTL